MFSRVLLYGKVNAAGTEYQDLYNANQKIMSQMFLPLILERHIDA